MRAVMNSKQVLVAMAVVVLAVVVAPVAIAADAGQSAAPGGKAVKQLKKQVRGLQAQLAKLQAQIGGPRTPSGPAGGDLTGAFPNPVIGPNTVGAAEIQKDAVGTEEIKDDTVSGADVQSESITGSHLKLNSVQGEEISVDAVGVEEIAFSGVNSSEISNGAVGALELDTFKTAVTPNGTAIGAGQNGSAEVTCPGESVLLAGGFAWADDEPNSIIYSAPSEASPSKTWVVRGHVPAGSNVLYAWASCLQV